MSNITELMALGLPSALAKKIKDRFLAKNEDSTVAAGTTLTVAGTQNVTGTLQIGGTAVTATAAELNKLDGQTVAGTSLNTGFIPLDITRVREIASDAIQNLAAHGGIMASDSAPILERVNGATDKALRLRWVASNVDEVQFPPVPMPPDIDAASDVTVHLLVEMAGATDTPTIDIQAFDAKGDTEMGGATGAASDTIAEVSTTLAAANISGHPTGFLNIALVPGAHGTDALHLYAAWIEYTRA